MLRRFHAPASDRWVLWTALALLAIGLPMVYSASHLTDGGGTVLKQAVFAGIGLVGAGMMQGFDYRLLLRSRRLLLVLTLIALILTLVIARPINGARSWIDLGVFRLQPSELAKMAMIVAFASLLHHFGPRICRLRAFARTLLFFALPVLLVLAQPDFGTAVILCAIWLVMVFVAGARWWMVSSVLVSAILLFTLAWHVTLPGGRVLIKPYQKARLDFIHADPAGNGFHQAQARIAIGAGQVFGKGYLQSSQTRLGFLPEQETDFIFAVIGEEFGLLGCLVLLGLYGVLLLRMLKIAEEADTQFGRLLVSGVAAMFAMHVVINIGMCLTLSPVTGVPLPLISYGGSNLLTMLLGIGLVLNVSRYAEPRRQWAAEETRLLRVDPSGARR